MPGESLTRNFFLGFVRLHILYHAARDSIYGAEIAEELVSHGYRLSQGTLYPTLHQMEELGYLSSRTEVVDGRRRKYYRATALGHRVLREARRKLQELVSEILDDQDRSFRTMREKRNRGDGRRRRRDG